MLGKRPSFVKKDKISKVINSIDVIKNGIPKYATFDEWKECGFFVMKGEKSYRKEDGVAVFHRDQVEEMRYYDGSSDEGDWWDMCF